MTRRDAVLLREQIREVLKLLFPNRIELKRLGAIKVVITFIVGVALSLGSSARSHGAMSNYMVERNR